MSAEDAIPMLMLPQIRRSVLAQFCVGPLKKSGASISFMCINGENECGSILAVYGNPDLMMLMQRRVDSCLQSVGAQI